MVDLRPKPPKGGHRLLAPLRLAARGDKIVVWLDGAGTRSRRIGAVNRHLAADARRHGQDLIGELVDLALLEADRRSNTRGSRRTDLPAARPRS